MYNKLPENTARVMPHLFYNEIEVAYEWLVKAFGFETYATLKDKDERPVHYELKLGDGMIMLGKVDEHPIRVSPLDANNQVTQGLFIYVDDVDAHYERARSAGCKILIEPTDMYYGERIYACCDIEGHLWKFAERFEEVDLNTTKRPEDRV